MLHSKFCFKNHWHKHFSFFKVDSAFVKDYIFIVSNIMQFLECDFRFVFLNCDRLKVSVITFCIICLHIAFRFLNRCKLLRMLQFFPKYVPLRLTWEGSYHVPHHSSCLAYGFSMEIVRKTRFIPRYFIFKMGESFSFIV